MNQLLLSTALVTATAFGAAAQTATTETPSTEAPAMTHDSSAMFRDARDAMEIHASDLIGKRVYASEAALDADGYDGMQDGWEDVGEVHDVVLSRDGSVEAVLLDIGGFLGIGEREVAMNMSAIRFVSDEATPEDLSDYFLVVNASRVNFEEAPAYTMDEGTMEHGAADTTTTPEAAPTTAMDSTQSPVREGYMPAEPEYLTAERLTGTAVYDPADVRVGEVSELILTDDGQISQAVVDVGGFLGIGEKPVALPIEELEILRSEDGNDVMIHIGSTKEQLESMPAFEG